jgi:hypothetical protein
MSSTPKDLNISSRRHRWRQTSGAAGNGLYTTIKYIRGAAGIGLGTTI